MTISENIGDDMKSVYHSDDCNLEVIKNETVAIIGYGIQGRAQGMNLRDSGVNVIVGNRDDNAKENAKNDGFKVYTIPEAVQKADILMVLIPDESQQEVFSNLIVPHMRKNQLVTFAHGYSLRYNKITLPENIDVALLAPRFPGEQIRNFYLQDHGAPAFIDMVQNSSGKALERTLALGLGIGFARAGMLKVSYKEETDIDLFVEHFLAPLFFRTMEESLEYLVKKGYSKAASVLELYFSGERGAFWTMVARDGIYNTLKSNASPTCQFGISHYIKDIFDESLKKKMEVALDEIQNNKFAELLDEEEAKNYPATKKFYSNRADNIISQSEREVNKLIRKPKTHQ